MEINLGTKGVGNVNFGCDLSGMTEVKPTKSETVSVDLEVRASSLDALQKSEPVAEIPETALSRDDELGKLVSAAFNLPPPPMPEFKT